jgi:hypothetical protein
MHGMPIVVAIIVASATLITLPESAIAAERENVASLEGRVLYGGEPPEPRLLDIPLRVRVRRDGINFDTEELPERRRLMEHGVPDETLIVGDERGIKNVVVWLRSKDVPVPVPPPGPAPPVTLRAVGGRFVPHVLVYWNISPLRLVNDTGSGMNFNLHGFGINKLLRDGESFAVEPAEISRQRLPTPIISNVQPWYSAYAIALNHPYFAVTGDDGRFKIDNVPRGEWEFVFWHEIGGYLRTDKYPAARLQLKIDAAPIDLGDLTADAKGLERRIMARELFGNAMPPKAGRGVNAISRLHQAVMAGNVDTARNLLRIGVNVNDRELRLNSTALHLAARHGHSEIARILIDKGATVDARDVNNCTPLMWAAKGGHSEVVRALLDANSKIDAKDNRDWTALHFACDRGHAGLAQLLIDRGADRNAKNRDGRTPLDLKLDHEDRASP